MKLTDLKYTFPDELIATEPVRPSRVLWASLGSDQNFTELSFQEFLGKIPAGDVLVINDTKVLKRRIFTDDQEIVFIRELALNQWEVLFQASKNKVGDIIELPFNVKMRLLSKGRPQVVEVSTKLTEKYFEQAGEVAIPPYIQKMRHIRKPLEKDSTWYQSVWASQPGSLAAPTASLHFSDGNIEELQRRGVSVVKLTLHVGLGTFLPVQTEDLSQHQMHEEYVEVPALTWSEIMYACEMGRGVWALGTTVARSLESVGAEIIKANDQGDFAGVTQLKIIPGYEWKIVNRLITNFHQPESTLLALVMSFAGVEFVRKVYQFVIENKFRLFSYGDLSVWIKK